jgi:hypothetical protein
MSATVRFSGKLPEGDRNGLAAIAPALVNSPDDTHVAIVVLQTTHLSTDIKGGGTTPTVALVAIEPITQSTDAKEVERLLRRQLERRTGQTEIPIELERELEALAADIDLTTGEIMEGQLEIGNEPLPQLEDLGEDNRLDTGDDTFGPGFLEP